MVCLVCLQQVLVGAESCSGPGSQHHCCPWHRLPVQGAPCPSSQPCRHRSCSSNTAWLPGWVKVSPSWMECEWKPGWDSGVAGLGNEAILGSLQCVPASLQGWAVGRKGTAELSAEAALCPCSTFFEPRMAGAQSQSCCRYGRVSEPWWIFLARTSRGKGWRGWKKLNYSCIFSLLLLRNQVSFLRDSLFHGMENRKKSIFFFFIRWNKYLFLEVNLSCLEPVAFRASSSVLHCCWICGTETCLCNINISSFPHGKSKDLSDISFFFKKK